MGVFVEIVLLFAAFLAVCEVQPPHVGRGIDFAHAMEIHPVVGPQEGQKDHAQASFQGGVLLFFVGGFENRQHIFDDLPFHIGRNETGQSV